MRIVLKTSKFAIWSRRLGSVAFPALLFSIYMHRSQSLDSEAFRLILKLIYVGAALAILFALIAFIILWFSGDRGWGRALSGLILGSISISPLIFSLIFQQNYIATNDVSTNPKEQIEIISPLDRIKPNNNIGQTKIIRAFPNIIIRYYPVEAKNIYQLARQIILQNGWEIIAEQKIDEGDGDWGQINAIATSIFGWRDEIAVLIEENNQGSSVKMRSLALYLGHDLGRNGRRVEKFLLELDDAVNKFSRDNVNFEQPPIPHVQRGE